MDASIILLEGLLLARKQNSSALWLYIHFLLLYVKGTGRNDEVGGDLHAHHAQQWAWRLANVNWYGKCSKCQGGTKIQKTTRGWFFSLRSCQPPPPPQCCLKRLCLAQKGYSKKNIGNILYLLSRQACLHHCAACLLHSSSTSYATCACFRGQLTWFSQRQPLGAHSKFKHSKWNLSSETKEQMSIDRTNINVNNIPMKFHSPRTRNRQQFLSP